MKVGKSASKRWQFSVSVLMPALIAFCLTAASVLGFLAWTTSNIDEKSLARQSETIRQVMQSRRNQMIRELGSVTGNDDAVVNTRLMFNADWIHDHLGRWMYDFFGHERTMVLDADNQPRYVMQDGLAVSNPQDRSFARPILSLVNQVRALPPALPVTDGLPPLRGASDFAVIDGVPAMIAVTAITFNAGTAPQQPGTEWMVASVMFLDDTAASLISRDYNFDDGRFSLANRGNSDRAVFPIANNAGRFVAFFEWERSRPGLVMLRQTTPIIILGMLLAGLLFILLLLRLRASTDALETGRRNAEHQAAHDLLTGLPNRMTFDNQLAQMLSERTGPNSNVALLMLDLDRFKQVNDTLGHQAGDELIRTVGKRIRQVVGEDPLIARLGGDEFIIMITDREQIEDATAIASRLIDAIGQPFDLHQFKAHVGTSVGIVTARGPGHGPYELMRKADIALYEAKATGRNRHVVYEEHMDEQVQLQHTIEGELREALQRDDQLAVVFQPLVDQRSRRTIGAEALARWHHPKFGQISPARFIPVAETTGLIVALGEFVLRRACALGAQAPGHTIAVNISPTQLRNPRFANQVFAILNQTGMRPGDLELEITESILLDDEHVSAENLRTFRAAGIHIALDDFGTGYSSLSYLKRYPVDRVKIDRSFIIQLAEGHMAVDITRAIVTLAHAMDLQVTAEGVETESQANILGQLGCNTLQGFLFSGGVIEEQILARFRVSAERDEPQPIRAA